MKPEEINQTLGSWEQRQAGAKGLAEELAQVMKDSGYSVVGPTTPPDFREGDRPVSSDVDYKKLPSVVIEYRAKKSESMSQKMERFGETLKEMLDIYGLRVTTQDIKSLEKAASIVQTLWGEPSLEDMTLRGGELVFWSRRDYRKRDWPGASPLTGKGYDEAIHINRKTPIGICEIQIMTADLHERYYSEGEAGHTAFRNRQNQAFKPRKVF